jgi:CubicO group peptidase (beta-lactamase class C family)
VLTKLLGKGIGMKAIVAAVLMACSLPAEAKVAEARKVEALARQAMAESGARGLAVAVIDNGRIASVQAFGDRNATGDPLNVDTIMYGASITKAVFAYTVMQLAEEGKVDLDRSIADYFPKPLPEYGNLDAYGNWGDLAGDERWRKITPRILLTHSSGFRNFSWDEPDQKLRINFEPGGRYSYSGEGIILLQFALEAGLGLKLGEEMQRRVFDRFGMTNTSMMWRPDFSKNLADGWKADGSVEPHDERSKVRAAGSMDTSIADLAEFAAGFMRGEGLKPASRAEMIKSHLPITSRAQFPVMAPEAPPADRWKGLAAGLGVVTFTGPQGRGFFKGGHNDSTANILACVERRRRCVVLLSNDVRAEAAFPNLVDSILGETGLPWGWEYPAFVK